MWESLKSLVEIYRTLVKNLGTDRTRKLEFSRFFSQALSSIFWLTDFYIQTAYSLVNELRNKPIYFVKVDKNSRFSRKFMHAPLL